MYRRIKRSSNPKKDNAWKWFSKYIRLRDAIKTTGDIYYCQCITCGEVKPIEEIHAGHAIAGRMNSILFNEDLVSGQCKSCNCDHGGEYQMYKRVLIERHGQEKWDYWQSIKSKTVSYTQFDFEQIAKVYREKVKKLEKYIAG